MIVALALAVILNIDSIHIVDSYIRNEGMRQAVIAQRDSFERDYHALVASLDGADNSATVTRQQLEESFKDSQAQLNVLTNAGFPIGPTYFPHSCRQDGDTLECRQRNSLGAPFWYDAIRGISRAVEGTRTTR